MTQRQRWTVNALTERLGVDLPIVQAPLGGGPGTPELTAAVSAAGGLGFLGAGYLEPDGARDAVRRTKALTGRPFGVNLFLPSAAGPPRRTDTVAARARIEQVAAELGLEAEVPDEPGSLPDHREQLAVLVEEGVAVISFTFGCPDRATVRSVQASGALCMGTAGTAEEARRLAEAGVEAVVAQGFEAGGHRGGSTAVAETPGLVALVPAVVDAVDVPVVASGGIMDGRGVVAALALGAQAAALGTAFLRTAEAGTNESYRQALRDADETSTVTTQRVLRTARPGHPQPLHRRVLRGRRRPRLPGHELPDAPAARRLGRARVGRGTVAVGRPGRRARPGPPGRGPGGRPGRRGRGRARAAGAPYPAMSRSVVL